MDLTQLKPYVWAIRRLSAEYLGSKPITIQDTLVAAGNLLVLDPNNTAVTRTVDYALAHIMEFFYARGCSIKYIMRLLMIALPVGAEHHVRLPCFPTKQKQHLVYMFHSFVENYWHLSKDHFCVHEVVRRAIRERDYLIYQEWVASSVGYGVVVDNARTLLLDHHDNSSSSTTDVDIDQLEQVNTTVWDLWLSGIFSTEMALTVDSSVATAKHTHLVNSMVDAMQS